MLTPPENSNVIAVIPARYRSTRFPGKPLSDIHGKPMIARVYEAVAKCSIFDWITVATDDERISDSCDANRIPWVFTDSGHPTGTDRVAEVSRLIKSNIYVNIQGDEPMLEPGVIEAAVHPLLSDTNKEIAVTNLASEIRDPAEAIDSNVIKVGFNHTGKAIYLSRLPIPYPKSPGDARYYKQVCVYGFRKAALQDFSVLPQGPLELSEGIELLRFIEHGIPVQFHIVESNSISVDTPDDLERVNALFSK
jgi:3-deoxy-manno-octulosonate cytidylyltransferase (CMP-KDO synthetase)